MVRNITGCLAGERLPDGLTGQFRALLLCLLFLAAHTANAAITHPARWRLDAIEQTYAGTWCFRPGTNPPPTHACNNSTLTVLLNAHVNNDHGPGLSIAYYDLKDASVLGGVGWADWDAMMLPVGVCMSGAVDSFANTYSTTCRFAMSDNDHETPSAHITECSVNRPQLRVTDGCYTPPPRRSRFRLDDSASGILTIIGLIIALPSIVLGAYRWYSARRALALQQAQLEDGQVVPLVPVDRRGGDGAIASQEPHLRDAAHSD